MQPWLKGSATVLMFLQHSETTSFLFLCLVNFSLINVCVVAISKSGRLFTVYTVRTWGKRHSGGGPSFGAVTAPAASGTVIGASAGAPTAPLSPFAVIGSSVQLIQAAGCQLRTPVPAIVCLPGSLSMTGKDLSFVVAMAVVSISVAMTASVAVAGVLIEEALYAAIAWEFTGSYEGTCYTVCITINSHSSEHQHISCPCAAINHYSCLEFVPNTCTIVYKWGKYAPSNTLCFVSLLYYSTYKNCTSNVAKLPKFRLISFRFYHLLLLLIVSCSQTD